MQKIADRVFDIVRAKTSRAYWARYVLNKGQLAVVRCRVALRRSSPLERVRPTFFVIGAQKAGTTTLFAHMCQHPKIVAPLIKEVHYFENPRNFSRGLDWYLSHFPNSSDCMTGEATPSYYHPLVPERVAAQFPDAKLILLARNPVDRAYSHYQRQVRRGREPLPFETALESESDRIEPDLAMLAKDPLWPAMGLRTYSYRWQGRYLMHINRWLSCFSKDNLLVVPSESYFSQPDQTIAQILDFLGVDPVALNLPQVRNQGLYGTKMNPATRAALLGTYREANDELYEFLGRDFGWN